LKHSWTLIFAEPIASADARLWRAGGLCGRERVGCGMPAIPWGLAGMRSLQTGLHGPSAGQTRTAPAPSAQAFPPEGLEDGAVGPSPISFISG
jgi:hypothetical protein